MGFMEWLTGHDSKKESELMADFSKVATVVSTIEDIATTKVQGSLDAFTEAVNQFNAVNGVEEYIGAISIGDYEPLFDEIGSTIGGIATQIQSKADAIETYSKSSGWEKFLGTVSMAGAKVGEGILSVAEDIGDGVVSVVGWVAPKGSAVENWATDFVKKEWSHDVFNGYYNSDLAKMSAITEDSAAAGACKIVGKTVGYLHAGGVFSGIGKSVGLGTTKLGTLALKAASSSTWGATAAAAVGGFGQGTETGILKGKDINSAASSDGLISAGIQGGMAFVGGKIGEKMAKTRAVKSAKGDVDAAQAGVDTAQTDLDAATNAKNAYTGDKRLRAYRSLKDAETAAQSNLTAAQGNLTTATDALTTAQSAKLSAYQGYSDIFTRSGEKLGSGVVNLIKSPFSGGTIAAGTAAKDIALNNLALGTAQGLIHPVQTAQALVSPGGIATEISQNITSGMNQKARDQFNVQGNLTSGNVITPEDTSQVVQNATITNPKDPEVIKAGETKPTIPPEEDPIDPEGGNTGGNYSGYTDNNNNNGRNTGTAQDQFNDSSDKKDKSKNEDPVDKTDVKKTETTTPPTSAPTTAPEQTIVTPPSQATTTPTTTPTTEPVVTTPPSQETTPVTYTPTNQHAGGGYSESGGYVSSNTENGIETEPELEDLIEETTTSIDDVIKGSKYTKIPTSSTPIQKTTSGSSGSAVIPIAAGLSAAAAAGIGAKAYMDRKNNNDNGEDDDFDTEEWSENDNYSDDDTIDIEYTEGENELDADDEYSYQQQEEPEKYGARSNAELANLQ